MIVVSAYMSVRLITVFFIHNFPGSLLVLFACLRSITLSSRLVSLCVVVFFTYCFMYFSSVCVCVFFSVCVTFVQVIFRFGLKKKEKILSYFNVIH